MAVAEANLVPREDFSLENTLLSRVAENRIMPGRRFYKPVDPNWMRGFYDEYDQHEGFRDRHSERNYSPVQYSHEADVRAHPLDTADYDPYERSYHERGIGHSQSHEIVVHVDPYHRD